MARDNRHQESAKAEFFRLLHQDLKKQNDLPESLQQQLLERAQTLRIERIRRPAGTRTATVGKLQGRHSGGS